MIRQLEKLVFQLIIFAALFFAALSFIRKVNASEAVNLPLPRLSQEDVIGYKAGLRPYRSNGIRLEPEYWQGKLIIHDYGHGGSGISLSWGSARASLGILKQELAKSFKSGGHEIAVLGSGIIGLTTAHLLADAGWQVQVYASQFPPYTTSDIAPGLWNRVLIGGARGEAEKEMADLILRLSFQDFDHLSKSPNPEFEGVSPLVIYTFKENSPMKELPKGLLLESVPVKVDFQEGPSLKGLRFQSMLVDTSIYMPDLAEKARQKGVKFTQMTFETKEELSKLPQSIIFNCTGLGSRHLFKDESLMPMKGELIELKRQEGLEVMLAGPMKGGGVDLYLIPLHDKLILGGSYEEGAEDANPNLMLCEEILEHAREFFKPGEASPRLTPSH